MDLQTIISLADFQGVGFVVKMSISPGTGFDLFKLFITGGRLTVKQTEMIYPSAHRKLHAHNMAGMSPILFWIDGFCEGILRIEH